MFELFHIIIVIGYFIYIGSHIHRTERKGYKYIQKNIFVSRKNFVKDSINKIILLSFILFLGFTVSSTKSIILFIIVTLFYFLLNSPWNEFLLLNIFLRFSEIYKDMELLISVATLTLIIMTIIYVDDFIFNSEQDFDCPKIIFFYLRCLFLYCIYDIGYVKILSIICNSNIIVFNKNNTYTLLFYTTICYLLCITVIGIQRYFKFLITIFAVLFGVQFTDITVIFSAFIAFFSFSESCDVFFNNDRWKINENIEKKYKRINTYIKLASAFLGLSTAVWNLFNFKNEANRTVSWYGIKIENLFLLRSTLSILIIIGIIISLYIIRNKICIEKNEN